MEKKQKMLILILVFILLLGGAYVLYGRLSEDMAPDQLASQEQTQPSQVDQTGDTSEAPELTPAPDFTAYDAEGNAVNLSDYMGKPLVLNFWASWCGPCKSEMPEFQEKFAQLGDDVQFLMVNMTTSSRESEEKAKDYISTQGFTFPVLYDMDSDAAVTYSVYSLPTTYFISAEGYLIARAAGAIDGDTLQRGIDMIT